MDINSFLNLLEQKKIKYSAKEPMNKHTTFKTGGCADVFIEAGSTEELKCIISIAKSTGVPYFVIGKGSNLLISDSGIEGAVISLAPMSCVEVADNKITCGAGVALSAVCIAARDKSLTGAEFAYGIPGTAGGALFMNAGAYGGEMSQIVESAVVIDEKGDCITLQKEDMELGYRTSIFKKKDYIITEITIRLENGKREEITLKMEDLITRRKEKQPLSYPSAGSTFKRPQGNFAGALIEKNGLKGYSIGGAMVSELHAGFIINYNNATTEDILKLIRYVQKTVYFNDGVLLEPEVLIRGRTELLPYKSPLEI